VSVAPSCIVGAGGVLIRLCSPPPRPGPAPTYPLPDPPTVSGEEARIDENEGREQGEGEGYQAPPLGVALTPSRSETYAGVCLKYGSLTLRSFN
jgi:hypothetical protein